MAYSSFKISTRRLAEPKLVWQLLTDANNTSRDQLVKHPVDVTFLEKNLFAVADSEGHKVMTFNIQTHDRTEIAMGKIWPSGIATTPEGNIVVTDRKQKAVVTYDLEGQRLGSWDVYIKEDVKEGCETPCRPHGIAVTSKGNVIVTDTGPNKVKIFNQDGELIKEFGNKGTDLQGLRLPFYCCVTRKDDIVLSDNMNHCIKIFDLKGNFLAKIGSGQEWGQRKFQCPYGVCTDLEDNIVVADYETNHVSLFKQSGGFIQHILSKKDKCESPTGVAVGPCGHLVLTEANLDYQNIKVYKLYEETRQEV